MSLVHEYDVHSLWFYDISHADSQYPMTCSQYVLHFDLLFFMVNIQLFVGYTYDIPRFFLGELVNFPCFDASNPT